MASRLDGVREFQKCSLSPVSTLLTAFKKRKGSRVRGYKGFAFTPYMMVGMSQTPLRFTLLVVKWEYVIQESTL